MTATKQIPDKLRRHAQVMHIVQTMILMLAETLRDNLGTRDLCTPYEEAVAFKKSAVPSKRFT